MNNKTTRSHILNKKRSLIGFHSTESHGLAEPIL